MRILYLTINENIDPNKGGVSNKLFSKVAAIKHKVSYCKYINACPSDSHGIKETVINDFVVQVEIGVDEPHDDVGFYEALSKFISEREKNIDRIIMRYPFASQGLLKFSATFFKKIVFEHNTKEIEEIKLQIANKRYAPFTIRPSGFRFWYKEKKQPLNTERNIGPRIFDNAYAGACVTTEIAKFEQHRNPNYKTFVSSNFYNVKESKIIPRTYDSEKELLSLGMIVTTMSSWYGLDRLLSSFANVQDTFQLVLAGIDPTNVVLKDMVKRFGITKNLIVLGKLSKDRLQEFYSKVHLCFGSLGLHTIKLNYASTLKVKESISFGIPVAVGYSEEDFHAYPEFKPYYLQLSNDNSPINFGSIRAFANTFYSDKRNQQKLRDLALKYIDVDVKVAQLIKNIS